MTSVFHRDPLTELPTCVGGKGAYLFDKAGKEYLDASGGAAVSILGHGDHRVIDAIKRQADSLAFAHTAFFTTAPSEELAARLIANAPRGLEKVFFVSGGSEANETALKLARHYHFARGEHQRTIFLHRRQSYHGATLATVAVSGNRVRRIPYEAMLMPSPEVAPCYAYREQRDGESEADYGLRAANDLERAILDAGPDKVAAFIMEPVVGATLGAVAAVSGYCKRVREICDAYGVLLIADEVMCGMGRTGHMFACSREGITPDILTCAKGLGGGYQPIGAALVHGRIYNGIVDAAGRFEHGHTYIGHAIACAAALAVQKALGDDGLLERVAPLGERLRSALEHRFGQHPHVGDIRGSGAFFGIELVADRETKLPFSPAQRVAPRIKAAAMAEGLIIYPGQGSADGICGDHILIAPPYIWEEAEIEIFTDRLGRSLDAVLDRRHVAA